MNMRRVLLGGLLAIAAALPVVTAAPPPAEARVFFGVGFGFPVVPFGYPYPYYYAPPPIVYAPPPAYYAPPAYYPPTPYGATVARCVAPRNLSCPLHEARPVGAACGCPDPGGRYVPGRVG